MFIGCVDCRFALALLAGGWLHHAEEINVHNLIHRIKVRGLVRDAINQSNATPALKRQLRLGLADCDADFRLDLLMDQLQTLGLLNGPANAAPDWAAIFAMIVEIVQGIIDSKA